MRDPRVDRMAKEILGLERKVNGLSTSRRMDKASIEDSSLPTYDADGNLVTIIGKQPDGTHGVVDYHGPIPPAPVGVDATGGPLTVTAVWGGQLAAPRPLDLNLIEVYASTEPFSYIEEAEIVGAIVDVDGSPITFARPAGTWHIGFVAVSRAGKRSELSRLVTVEVSEGMALDDDALEKIADAVLTDNVFQGREFYGGSFIGANFRALQEAFELNMSGRGLTMISRQAAEVTRRFGTGGTLVTVGDEIFSGTPDGSIDVYRASDGELVRSITTPSGAHFYYLATDGVNLFFPEPRSDPTSAPRVRKVTPDGEFVDWAIIGGAVGWSGLGHMAIHPDGRIVLAGANDPQGRQAMAVISPSGQLQRHIPYPDSGGQRVSPTSIAIRGDVIYEGWDKEVRLWDINTGNLIDTWQVGPGWVSTVNISGNTLYVTLSEIVGGMRNNYVMGFNLADGVEGFHWTVPTLTAEGEGIERVVTVGEKVYASLYVTLAELSVTTSDTVQASISTATGSVMFRDPELRGTTLADNVRANLLEGHDGPNSLELRDAWTRRGTNVFETELERELFFEGAVVDGVECTTLLPTPMKWRMKSGWWKPVGDVPDPIEAKGANSNAVGAADWAHLSGGLLFVTLSLPYPCWVDITLSAALVMPANCDVRVAAEVTGATAVAPSAPNWSKALWGRNRTAGEDLDTFETTKHVRLNAGSHTIRVMAYIVGSVQGGCNYPLLTVKPVRWA